MTSPTSARAELAARLAARRAEVEDAVLTRIYSIADPTEPEDPNYVDGLRGALAAALDYGFEAIERGEGRVPVPIPLLAQARMAARNGVDLETVLRRYFAGYTLLGDFLVEEARKEGLLDGEGLKRVLRDLAALFDRLLVTVSEEYRREAGQQAPSPRRRRVEQVERLLAGELVEPTELEYELDAEHLGAVASGTGAAEFLRKLAVALDARFLLVSRQQGVFWAWFGRRGWGDAKEVSDLAERMVAPGVVLALGEPAEGLHGWRLSHRQAEAAMPIALRTLKPLVRYGEVALVAAVLRDRFLADSLREMFIAPLETGGDRGAMGLETLRAYFAAQRNAASAAAALGISRQAVNARLRVVEECLDRPVSGCAAELEVALRVHDLEMGFV